MNIKEILLKIEKEEIKYGTIFHGGDYLYPLMVIDKDIYVLNSMTKTFIKVGTKNIGRFLENNAKFYIYKKVID